MNARVSWHRGSVNPAKLMKQPIALLVSVLLVPVALGGSAAEGVDLCLTSEGSEIQFRNIRLIVPGAGAPGTEPAPAASGETLETGFINPPPSARPHICWTWMNGNVTREGITADLEAMARAGIGGALIFNLAGPHHHCDTPPGPVDYLGPAWLDLMKHAASEAERLGLELGMHNCAGWATTGGPWITPELAMQKLVSVRGHRGRVAGASRRSCRNPR